MNNEGQVTLRCVLFLLYLKHDQKIDRIRKNNNYCLYLPFVRGRRHVECLPFPRDDARIVKSTAFRQMATLVFATSRSTVDKRLIYSKNTTTIVFIYATIIAALILYINRSILHKLCLAPHHDRRFLLRAETRGGAYPSSRFSLVVVLND